MRTDPHTSRVLYTWITVQEAARRLGGVGPVHVLELGRQKLLRVTDLRLPGASRGVYRVDPDSVEKLIRSRELGGEEADVRRAG